MHSSQTMAFQGEWLPLSFQYLSSTPFIPTAIADYAQAFSIGKKPPHSLAVHVRKQLFRLNWKIEFMKDRKSFRYRYTSPTDGKIYLSLHLLCNDLCGISNSGSVCFDSHQQRSKKRKKREDDEFLDSLSSEVSQDEGHEQPIKVKQAIHLNPTRQTAITVRQASSSNRTRLCTLSGLIDNNLVMEGEKVHYRAGKNRPQLTGRIARDGIECGCCRNILALTEFEAHAGSTNHRPAANIILEDGRSLSDCHRQLVSEGKVLKLNITRMPHTTSKSEGKILKLKITRNATTVPKKKKKREIEDEDESDYVCSICLQGGDLILCDECPSAFHKSCLGIQELPFGDWYCPFCCCDYCKCRKLSNLKKDSYILRCEQCPRKVHLRCAEDRGMMKLKANPNWFCSDKCKNIYHGLQNLLGKPIVVGEEDNLTWTLLKGRESDSFENDKLGLALELMHRCFEPLVEYYTGRDLVEDVIFSRECDLNRMNFRRFYTILLERDDEAISVANLRVSGDKVAELPLVATGFQYRRLGMCRRLMNEIEKQLANLGVEKLVLPSASTALQTWTDAFGFSVMTDSDKQQFLNYNILSFQGTTMCQKFLGKMQ